MPQGEGRTGDRADDRTRTDETRARGARRTPGRRRGGPPSAAHRPAVLPDDPRARDLAARLPELSLRDEQRLLRRLHALAGQREPARFEEQLTQLTADVDRAAARVQSRRAAVPALHYPPELPVSQEKDRVAAALREHQVVVVAGETGSGKTTQLPKICLELGRGVRGTIGHTQPRRIAARAVAERVAEEVGTQLGDLVGYAVRFTDQVSDSTLVKVMTDGILLAEVQRDRDLRQYDTIIIDEAHERSLNIDFLLGYLKQLLPRRPELKLVITSATIETGRFAEAFGGAPVIEVSGRTYPVEVRYRPLLAADAEPEDEEDDETDDGVGPSPEDAYVAAGTDGDRDQTEGIVDAVRELAAEGPGDILVFLSGEREIRDTADALQPLLRERGWQGTEVLPLYARLSAEEQHRVFRTSGNRRIVLATNVAETSLTVPGIRYVVDAGTARISRYSHRTKVQRLPVERISQASANQRAGRCGRVAEGVCIRLYSEKDYLSRPEYTDPEILRTNLASVILQMASLGLGDVAAFPFVQPPEKRAITDGVHLLQELGALEPGSGTGTVPRLTPTGRDLARLPIDPRLGRMVLEGHRNGCLHDVLVVVAALSVQDPRERPHDQKQQAAQSHARFRHEQSDFLTYLNLWWYLQRQQRDLSSSAFRRRCKQEFLHHLRVREWQDTFSQLRRVARDLRMDVVAPELPEVAEEGADSSGTGSEAVAAAAVDADGLHRSLLAGLLANIGMKELPTKQTRSVVRPMTEYLGARGARFALFPGSSLGRQQPAWVMAAELVETSRLWARVAASIDPRWIEPLAEHVVKRQYSEPHWSRKRAAVVATERVTLYGVPIVAGRTVAYGRIDPELSRELFIRHALVEGDWDTRHEFFGRNRELLEEAEELEHRARRRDIVVDDEALFRFYDARVGAEVVSGRHFDTWWKQVRREEPDLLTFDPAMLVAEGAETVSESDYPDVWRQGDLALRLTYQFEPGSAADGVTVEVPLGVVNRLDADDFTWQVPGLRHDLATALIRSLPKALRKNFVPAPDVAAAVLRRVRPHTEPLTHALERELPRLGSGVEVFAEDFDWEKVPGHLRVTFRIVSDIPDAESPDAAPGTVLAEGKDFEALRQSLAGQVQENLEEASDELQRTGASSWDELPADIPATHTSHRGGVEVTGFPALVDEGGAVGVRTFATAGEAERSMWRGTRRLLLLNLPSPARAMQAELPNDAKLLLARAPHGSAAAVLDDCVTGAVDSLLAAAGGPVRTAGDFTRLLAAVRAGLPQRATEVLQRTLRVLSAAAEVERALSRTSSLTLVPSLSDVRGQLSELLAPGFVTATGFERLPDLLRYLRGAQRRLEALPANPQRDRVRMAELARVRSSYEAVRARYGDWEEVPAAVARVRWMLEELRISKFAQAVGTAHPVSEERVLKALAEVA
ncbi:ATP-dependent helicase HrpA [Kineococcus xinjiangensis]|uniref:ATP-dependent helicase HrpA n=1 Tax=Kineococcus xinjiangensis TaxID=512762 RepID=A0A2S6ID95_9ACTN|nr:ATP-dependent RNA helicase HrpA [Kineococcus xinjiangensis]PPK92194.1 ATP-dependent helicase HrpA [Kineococcus xinjiangensis]